MSDLTVLPRPSDAGRWCGGKCPGSVALAARYPRTAGAEAEDGTRLHDVAAGWLLKDVVPSEEDRAVVRRYVADVRQAVAGAGAVNGADYELHVERRVEWKPNPNLIGTPDAALIDRARKRLTIWDFKTGWALVEAFMNWQLLSYATILCPTGWVMDLRIVQPRPYHPDGPVRSWELGWMDLQPHRVWIGRAVREAMIPGATLRAGAHCLYCDALSGCPAARDVSLRAVEYTSKEPHDLPDDLICRELQVMRETLEILKLRTAALEELADSKLRSGVRLAGMALRRGSGGRTKWAQDDAATRSILQLLTGVDYALPKMPTPKQLVDSHDISPEIITPLTQYQPGKMVVSTDAAKLARKVFGKAPNMEHTK